MSHFRLVVDGTEYEPRRFPFDSVFFLTHAYSITGDAIRWLWSANVPLFVIDWHGRLQTSIIHDSTPKGNLRLAQYELYTDPQRREAVAKELVAEKIARQEEVLEEIGKPKSLSKTEFRAALTYWRLLGEKFRELGYEFTGRKDTDNKAWHATSIPNAVENYGYSILEACVRRSVNLYALDYSIGIGHRVYGSRHHRHGALSLDLMEPFRPDVDVVVVRLLESKPRITERDFTRNADDFSLRLRPATAERMIGLFEANLDTGEIRTFVREFARGLMGRPIPDTNRLSARRRTAAPLSPSLSSR